ADERPVPDAVVGSLRSITAVLVPCLRVPEPGGFADRPAPHHEQQSCDQRGAESVEHCLDKEIEVTLVELGPEQGPSDVVRKRDPAIEDPGVCEAHAAITFPESRL